MKKKQPRFTIHDYDSKERDPLGIFYRGEHILFGWEKDFGPREYHFKFSITLNDTDRVTSYIEGSKYKELFDFYHYCDLKDYIRYVNNPWAEEDEEKVMKFFDCEKLVKETQKKKVEHLKTRLRRNYLDVVPEPVIYVADQWHNGDEFLVFTNDSACCWAGPFTQDSKKGACMSIKKQYDVIPFPVIDVKKQWSYYNAPYATQKRLNEHPDVDGKEDGILNGDWLTHRMSPEEREVLFDTFLTLEEQHHVYRSYIRWMTDKEAIQHLLPYRIYLCGNDDCSYSKWLATQEQVDEEVKYLRKMQPLDMDRDIYKRDYIFTN